MKVLHLINNLKREGAQIVVFNLVASSDNTLIQHVVCAREPGGSLQSALEKRGVSVFVPDRYYGVFASRRSLCFIDEVIENEGIDLIHAHMADAAFLGWLAARKRALPLVITHHGQNILLKCSLLCRTIYYVFLAMAARYARINIAVSSSVADCVRRWLVLGSHRVKVITNGTPVPTDESVAKRNDSSSEEIRIVTVGRLVGLKGQDQLISAASILVEEYRNARFIMVGDGPLRESLQQQAQSLNLSDNIVFTGSVDDVPTYLRDADVYVSTSHTEGMPIATLEAMSWEVPVVASDIPGNRSVIQQGATGLLYTPGSIESLVEKIRQVLENPGPAKERACRARQSVKEHYSAEATITAYENLYSEILEQEH